MRFSIFEMDDGIGDVNTSIRLVTFSWNDVRSRFSNKTLGELHAEFNRRFVDQFPRLAYTNPFTSYTNATFGITGSRLTGTCETLLPDAFVRAWVVTITSVLGIDGDESKLTLSSRSIRELQSGQTVNVPGSTVTPIFTTDGARDTLAGLYDQYKWPIVAGGVVLTLLLLRR